MAFHALARYVRVPQKSPSARSATISDALSAVASPFSLSVLLHAKPGILHGIKGAPFSHSPSTFCALAAALTLAARPSSLRTLGEVQSLPFLS
jgi:hypothetical protein